MPAPLRRPSSPVRNQAPMLHEDRPAAPGVAALDALTGEGRFDHLAAALFADDAR